MNEENKAVIKALNMYGRVPETWELLEEIERLNNIINNIENDFLGNYYGENARCIDLLIKENQELKKQLDYLRSEEILQKYKEIIGDDKE